MARPTTADHALVRKVNASLILSHLRLNAPLSRAELAGWTGLNRSTVSLIINELIDQGFVHETMRQDPKIGRPGMLLQFNPDAGFAIGVEMGVDFITVIATNFIAEVIWRQTELIGADEEQIAIMERAEQMISAAMDFGRDHGLRPLGIGVGMPGLVDAHQGKLVFAPNLKWVDMPIRLIWTRRFNLPVFVENEANCAALGEHFFGVAHDIDDFIYLKTGVGLGGGIMIGGRLFRGATGFAGEIGHITLYEGGDTCGCGRRGCWETYVSPTALVHMICVRIDSGESSLISELVQDDLSKLDLDVIIAAARQGDAVTLKVLEQIGVHLGVGISNLVNIFNPQLVVLGGALSLLGKWLIPIIKNSLQANILPPLRDSIRVESSPQGLDACVLGAVALVLDDILREPLYA